MTIITGLGTAVPQHRISQNDAAGISKEFCCSTPDDEETLRLIFNHAGVQTRHCTVLDASDGPLESRQSFYTREAVSPSTAVRMQKYENAAGRLAGLAAQRALVDAGVAADSITHLITVTCTGFCAPGFDIALIRDLPLRADVSRTQIGFMGCHAALNALRVARAYCDAEPSARVLLCAVELCSIHHKYDWELPQIVANALFGDGAAAVVLTGGDAGAPRLYEVVDNGSVIVPGTEDAMTWRIGDDGFRMTLSQRVPELIARHLRPWLDDWLAGHGLTVDAVGSWAVHPGGPRILSAVAETAGLPANALATSYAILAEYGNMSSPTVLFLLDRLRQTKFARPVVTIGFGPGLAVEAALLR